MECALLALSTKPEPSPVRRAHVSQEEASPLPWTSARRRLVRNLRMVVAHLRVLLDAECVLLVPADGQPRLVDGDHPVARGSLEDVQLAHGRFRRRDDFELREAHLEHHVARQGHLLPHHDEGARRGADITQVEIR